MTNKINKIDKNNKKIKIDDKYSKIRITPTQFKLIRTRKNYFPNSHNIHPLYKSDNHNTVLSQDILKAILTNQ